MKLDRLILTGLSDAFPGVVDLPLHELPEGLVALVGPNGEGKTTILEATPGAIFRKLPAREDVDPIEYAGTRASSIDLTFRFDGIGAFRARLNLDGPKRKSDAVLEQLMGVEGDINVPLNDGKVSTYDAAVKERFPSYELFINSSFAAQGRGDEFTRAKPSARKDLFAEFLSLRSYFDRAKTAGEAAELAGDARLRLQVQIETLERDTAPAFFEELERQTDQLQRARGDAEVRQRELKDVLARLEARAAAAADQVAAYTTATERVRTLEQDLAGRQVERAGVTRQRTAAAAALADEQTRIVDKRKADVDDATKRIAKNQAVIGLREKIETAVTALAVLEEQLAGARADVTERQAELTQAAAALRAVEKELAALDAVEQRRDRAQRDSGLLTSVPCGGAGDFAVCQFLKDATAAQTQLETLNAQLQPKANLADRVGRHAADVERLTQALKVAQAAVVTLAGQRPALLELTQYTGPLADATAKIAGYEAAKAKAEDDANEQVLVSRRRHEMRDAELEEQGVALDETIDRLTNQLATAKQDLAAAVAGNNQAVSLNIELAAARAEWDHVTTTLATAVSGAAELERRRGDLTAKRERLDLVRDRLARVDRILMQWRDLAKTLGKGGLPDLEIDAAGPTITATTNELLSACFGPRFSLELVTQVAKADGDGMKDLFTVLVMDNTKPARGWKDLKFLSGGQKVVVQEALMCAIALYVNARAALPIRTLWRDETGAALDPVNAIAYVQMLRKVRELGNFHHVFFITHDAESAALADAQIRCGGGQAAIAYPPFATSEAA